MGNCKYLEEVCRETCKVNENGVHVISYNGKTGIFKLNSEGHPTFLGTGFCPRYAILYYLDNPENIERQLLKTVKEHKPVLIVYSPDHLIDLFEKASVFGMPDSVGKYIKTRLHEITSQTSSHSLPAP